VLLVSLLFVAFLFSHGGALFFFVLLFSCLQCYYPLFFCIDVLLLFTLLLFSFWHCYFLIHTNVLVLHFPICVVILLFMLLLSSLPRWYYPILGTRIFVLLFSFLHYCYPFVLLLFLCCYSLKDFVLPPCIPSCKSWESLRIGNLRFFLAIFFPFFI
jgi:hypothetical protein